jgi:uncharacterized protein (TIGR03492 family)
MVMTFLSNGYGEDTIAALLMQALQSQQAGLTVQAFPTVDRGNAYESLKIPILGPRQVMPSGGLLFHNLELFLGDLRAGFVPMTLQQLRDLRQLETEVLVVVGDAYALLLSSLVRCKQRFYLQTLVSAHHAKGQGNRQLHRYFMEHFSLPERYLMNRLCSWVYVRDQATADVLTSTGFSKVSALGNPMLDGLAGRPMPEHQGKVLALLPGTRSYRDKALELMLAALTQLPEATALVAWSGGPLPSLAGWQAQSSLPPHQGLKTIWQAGTKTAWVYEGRFADILHSSQLVLGTAGTANEQAAALGKPVISFPVKPLYSSTFLDNQKRLLADALTITLPEPTAIARAVETLLEQERYAQAALAGPKRMGKAGGSAAIAQDILSRIQSR